MGSLSGQLRAVLLRQWRSRLVYRWAVLSELLGIAGMLVVFWLIDRFQTSVAGDVLREALPGVSYFGFVVMGLAISEVSTASLGGVLGQFQEEKRYGTLEWHIASGCSIHRWALLNGVAKMIRAIFHVAMILFVAVAVMGLRFPQARWDVVALVFVAGFLPLWSLSVVSMASTLLFRRGNVFGFLMSSGFEILGGVYVPLAILPDWTQSLAQVLPITPALRAARAAAFEGAGFQAVSGDLFQLLLLGAVFLPFAWGILLLADRGARRRGHYALE